ncbi:DUF3999 family protein [Sphingomonas sp.]|jgi:hypothetical protein|uniref:DUF3999 family protein n=1 Tax=Sphingomonas sp. TaxID=28214 RepID=UPI002DF6BC5E|nr:DUF3999 family protein [Sphingomonas sp.]
MIRKCIAPLLAILTLAAAAPAGSDAEPSGYAARFPLTTSGTGPQRLTLPAAVLVKLQEPDGRDLRIFDSRGRAMPIARVAPSARLESTVLAVSPILGPASLSEAARVSVEIDEEGRARFAEVQGGAPPSRTSTAVLGALLDARRTRGTAERLEIDADLPQGQPVRLQVEASRDLDVWRPIAERVVYRAPGSQMVREAILLRATLDREYLRLTWRGNLRLIAPVAIRGATLVTRAGSGQVSIETRPPAPSDPHTLEFVLPFGTLVTSVKITPAAGEGPVPVRILGRDEPEQQWRLLGEGSAEGADIRLQGTPVRTIRIEADRRTPGFERAPSLQLGLAAQDLAFRPAGRPPFMLAAGRKEASDPFLPLRAVTGGKADLAQAAVWTGPTAALVLAAPDPAAGERRKALLWAVLLAAVALLGGLAWLLWRRSPKPA